MISIVLADSCDLIRIGLRAILSQNKDFEILGEASEKDELVSICKAFKPQIVLIDYTTEEFGIDIIQRAILASPKTRFVAITNDQLSTTIIDAIKGGITSYIKKSCSVSEIIDSVRDTAAGNKFFCGKILERIKKEQIPVDDPDILEFTCAPIALSERELEVIKLIAEGFTNIQIADMIHLSAHTVNTHRKNIMKKLGINNTAGIVLFAVKSDLVSPNKFLFASSNSEV
ncbi:MAG: LuxR C-terminal-related transcriptional regulator [Flavobacteriales bacterium]